MVLTVVSVFSFTRLTQTLVEQRDSELVRLAAQQIADNWADSVLLLTQVAATEVVRSGDITATEQLVTGNVALLGRFDRISMTDSDGVVIVTVGGQLGENVSGRDYFDRARRLRRAVRSELYEDEAGSRLIAVAVPVYDLLGQFSGCMLGIWDLAGDTLGAPVASVQVGEGGYAYLVDENGVILYHPDAALIGTDASRHPAVAAVMAGETGARALSVSGGTTMVSYAPIPIHGLSSSLFGDQTWEGWGLLTSEMWEDIVAPLSPYVRFMAAMLTLLVALPLVVLTLSSARIAAPLQSLVTQVDRWRRANSIPPFPSRRPLRNCANWSWPLARWWTSCGAIATTFRITWCRSSTRKRKSASVWPANCTMTRRRRWWCWGGASSRRPR